MKAGLLLRDDSRQVCVEFPFNPWIKDKLKQIDGSRWDPAHKWWLLPFTDSTIRSLVVFFPEIEFSEELKAELKNKGGNSAGHPEQIRKVVRVTAIQKNHERYLMIQAGPAICEEPLDKIREGIEYDPSLGGWTLKNKKENLRWIFSYFKGKAWVDASDIFEKKETPPKEKKQVVRKYRIDLPPLSEENTARIKQFCDFMRSSRYSDSTLRTYSDSLRTFFRFLQNKPVEDISNADLIAFNNQYILDRNYSSTFQNQVINAIKLYFMKIENRKMEIESIERPRREKKLPNVLSRKEIEDLIKAATINIKHKAMLSLVYSCGLRRGEVLNLKIQDIDSNRGLLIIRNAKGKKDRIAPLSLKIIELLRDYYKQYKTTVYLFEGWVKGEKYSDRSIEEVLKKYLKLAKIYKPVTLHWLRHSYATHLLEGGTDLRYIQEILGHKSSKTTEIYTHVSTRHIQQIKSPFDDLEL